MVKHQGALLPRKLQMAIIIVLVVNTVLIGAGLGYLLFRLPRGDAILFYKQELARDLADYNHRLAGDAGVIDERDVREALAQYNYAVERAEDGEELIKIIFEQGRRVQEAIFREAEALAVDEVLVAVNRDRWVTETKEKAHISIRVAGDQVYVIPENALEPYTVQRISRIVLANRYFSKPVIDMEVENGRAELVAVDTMEDQLAVISEDLDNLRLRLHELRVQSGQAEMVGPGISIKIYDARDVDSSTSLVHDADIRDIVNELFSSGARGVAVGGERLTVTSSIRCSGPLIMVNYRQVSTNPVVIEAVGQPEMLVSELGIISGELESRRGLIIEITQSGFVKLPAYEEGSHVSR